MRTLLPTFRKGLRRRAARTAFALVVLCGLVSGSLFAQAAPSRHCPDGVVGHIEIDNQDVFPTAADDPRLLRWAFAAADFVHITTTRSFIRRELLIHRGDCYDPFLVSESRRVLSQYDFIDQVRIDTIDSAPGVKTIRVWTRDSWSTRLDAGVTYDERRLNLEHLQASEDNFLGEGITAQISQHHRREKQDEGFRFFTPRFFGTTDADLRAGGTKAGSYFFQRFNHGFVGDVSRFSASELIDRGTDFYSYATAGTEPFTQVLLPMSRDREELAAAVRLGAPSRSWILGLSLERDIAKPAGPPELVWGNDFGGAGPGQATLPPAVAEQTGPRGATRLALHIGTRRFRYRDYTGVDALGERDVVSLGFFGGISVGRSLGIGVPRGVRDASDTYGRLYTTLLEPVGRSLAGLSVSAEGGRAHGGWRDLLAQGSLYGWGRGWLPGQTFFVAATAAGGWRTSIPFQLSLGGRDGVRSLPEDALPGGQRLLLIGEDRILFPWPAWSGLGLGATVFVDAGRIWAGDAPFGIDSGWKGSAGFGLRIAAPANSRNVWIPEISFPLGRRGPPIFRVTFELHQLRYGIHTSRWEASRRFYRGPESF